jgi:A-factor biosynthesis hotdog domain
MGLAVIEQRPAASAAPSTLARPPAGTDKGSAATLHVDQDNSFFFDHPLDHVPGMLLVAGLLDLVRALDGEVGDARTRRLALSLTFSTLCELDEPTQLLAVEHRPAPFTGVRTWTVRAGQRDRTACEGRATLRRDAPPPTPRWPRPRPAPHPVEARLVHRSRHENVLLGAPEHADGAFRVPVLRPAFGSFLLQRGNGGYCIETLIEAGRQLATLFAHTVAGHPLGMQLLWCGLEADLPWTLPGEAALALCSRPEPAKGRRMRYRTELVGADDGRVHGTIEYGCMAVTPTSLRRFRAAGRAAGQVS